MALMYEDTNGNGSGSLKVFSFDDTKAELIAAGVPDRFETSPNVMFIVHCSDGTGLFRVSSNATFINEIVSGDIGSSVEYRSLGSFISTAEQIPTAEGVSGKIRVTFGVGGDTDGGEFTITPSGDIICNLNSIQYTFDVVLRLSRTGEPGNSVVMARLLYSDDGSETDTIQAGNTFSVRIDDDDTIWRESFNVTFSPSVGSKLWIEFARDEVGTNSGQLGADQPSGTLTTDSPSWGDVPSASLEISKLSVV